MARRKFDPEEVRRLYWDEKLSMPAIARLLQFGGGSPAVLRFMRRNDIPTRPIRQAVAMQWENAPDRRLKQAEWMSRVGKQHAEKALAARAEWFRRNQNLAEFAVGQILAELGESFEAQVPIGRYLADFVLAERRLVLEVDDPSHRVHWKKAADERRTIELTEQGWRVLRLPHTKNLNIEQLRAAIIAGLSE